MSHQPFETWILDTEALSKEDWRALQEHLQGCQQCQRIERKWLMVQRDLRARQMVAPAAGFVQRWQTGLVERRAREQRKQAWRIFLGFSSGSIIILLFLLGYALSVSSLASWLTVVIQSVTNSLIFAETVVSAVRVWLNSTPLALNVALWIYLTVTLCLLSLGWVFAVWRTSIVGVFNK